MQVDKEQQYDMKDYYVLTQTDYTKPATVGPKVYQFFS